MVLDQVECFLSACNIREQILLLKETNRNLTMSEAGKRIGKSYARIDHRKGTKASISKNIYSYTLNLKFFKEFVAGYKTEWEKLGGGSGRKEDEEVTQNKEAEK